MDLWLNFCLALLIFILAAISTLKHSKIPTSWFKQLANAGCEDYSENSSAFVKNINESNKPSELVWKKVETSLNL